MLLFCFSTKIFEVHVHLEVLEKTAEDEEFDREFERMLAEAHRQPTTSSAPTMDLAVPSGIRDKYKRTICFGTFQLKTTFSCKMFILTSLVIY